MIIALIRESEGFSDPLNVVFRTQPKSLIAKNGLLPLEIVDRMAHAQKEECEFIDYFAEDGEGEQEEDKDHDEHFDNHGDPAYDDSEVVDA